MVEDGKIGDDMKKTVVKKMRKKPDPITDREGYLEYKKQCNKKYYNGSGKSSRYIKYYKKKYNIPDDIIEANKDDFEQLLIALKTYALKCKIEDIRK